MKPILLTRVADMPRLSEPPGTWPTRSLVAMDQLAEALAEVNGRAKRYTYCAIEVMALAKRAEKRLDAAGVKVKNRAYTIVTAVSGVPTSKAYARVSGKAIGTFVRLERNGTSWHVVKVARNERWCGTGASERITLDVTPTAREDIINKALEGFTFKRRMA